MNEKGNIIITIVLILIIGLIVYFAYYGTTTSNISDNVGSYVEDLSNGSSKATDFNNPQDSFIPDGNLELKATLNSLKSVKIDGDIKISGIVNATCDNRELVLENPTLTDFIGDISLELKTINGRLTNIVLGNNIIPMNCTFNAPDFEAIETENFKGNFEEVGVSGNIDVGGNVELNNAYLRIFDFAGSLKISETIEIEGIASKSIIVQDGKSITYE